MRHLLSPAAGAALALAFSFAGLRSAPAQNASPTPASDVYGRIPEWRCTLPGGMFVVTIRSMVSVSMQEYVVDGAARVTEVNVDTTGNALARFYYIEPVTPQTPLALGQSTINKVQELAEEAAGRSGQEEVWKKVVKTYPTSTHAHTIEFRVGSKDDLKKIFDSADAAMHQAKNTAFTLK